jgi:exonuclease III
LPFFSCQLDAPQHLDPAVYISNNINKLNENRKHLSIAHLNTRSITSTFPQFEAMLKSHEFDVITLSETWLKDNAELLNYVEIPGYQFGFKNRCRAKGGGVGFYIKTSIKFKERKDITNLDLTMEHQWIEIQGKKNKLNILVGVLYQPSSNPTDKLVWLEKFDSLLSKVVPQYEGSVIVTGDFNINLLKSTTVTKQYYEILDTYNMTQNISKATRYDKSLIDHIVSTQGLKLIHQDVIDCDEISDHDAPFCILKASPVTYEPRYKFIRDERSLDMNDFVEDFSHLPLNIVYGVEDIGDKLDILNKLILQCIDRHASLRRVKLTRPPAPWMKDLKIIDLQRKRNQLRCKLRNNKDTTECNVKLLREVRNQLKKDISKTKQNFFQKLLRNKNSKEVWKTINKILHPNPKNC